MPATESAVHLIQTRSELVLNGYSPSRIDRRLRAKTLQRLHPTAYLDLTRSYTTIERWLAVLAALVAGARCPVVVSHRAAAVLHKLDGFNHLDGFDLDPVRYERRPGDQFGLPIDVMISHRSVLAAKVAIRSRTFDSRGFTMLFGLPVTSLARTILDLAEFAPPDVVEASVESALRPAAGARPNEWNSALFDELVESSAVHDRKRGTAIVRKIIDDRGAVRPTGSLPETTVVQALRRLGHRLDRQVTVRVFDRRGRIVAIFYPDLAALLLGVLIEIDGLVAHASSVQQRRDIERQNLLANFFTIRRYAAAAVLRSPSDVARSIARQLDAATTRPREFANEFGAVRLTVDGADIILR